MTSLAPDEGIEWFSDRSVEEDGAADEKIYDAAVGDGSTSVSASDTQLDQQVYRDGANSANVSIQGTAADDGVFEVRISVTGGTEVPAGTDITETGFWARDPSIPISDFRNGNENTNDADDKMLYRELRSAVTIEAGDTKTFSMKVDFDNA